MIARLVWLSLLALGAAGQIRDQEDILRLARAKSAIARHLNNMPNYTCLETVERYEKLPQARQESLVDVLRIEVAFVEGREMFAWPGSTRFEASEIRDFIATGAFSTGGFVLHARAIFLGDGAMFTFAGPDSINGAPAWRYDYVTPQFRSGYQIRNPSKGLGAIVAYHGSIWVRQDNLDLLRILIDTNDIPPEIEIEHSRDTLDYQFLPIGSGQALLPASQEIRITDSKGRLAINRTRLTRCRQFSGESTLSFADDNAASSSAQPRKTLHFEPYTELSLALTRELNHATSAVGDEIEAMLTHDIKQGKTILAPRGTLARGRILRLSRHETTHVIFNVTLEFTELIGDDFRAPLRLRFTGTVRDVSTPPELRSRRPGAYSIEAPATDPNGFLVFRSSLKLPRGFVTMWQTLK
ncbi:MAG: hypothetical protein ACK52Z_07940 [Acidobacteriota bacterium]